MKSMKIVSIAAIALLALSAFTTEESKLVSKNGHIKFFSHTVAEDITANNYKVVSTLEPSTGTVVFSAPMQSFEFEKALMQKHYNSKGFLDTKNFPKAKFVGTITNLTEINFAKDGKYEAHVEGELTMHGITKPVHEHGTITVAGNEVTIDAKMKITLADYEVAFEDGKPSTNVAKTIEATIKSSFTKS